MLHRWFLYNAPRIHTLNFTLYFDLCIPNAHEGLAPPRYWQLWQPPLQDMWLKPANNEVDPSLSPFTMRRRKDQILRTLETNEETWTVLGIAIDLV